VVETKSKLGSDRVERPVTLQRDYRVLLTTDKPIYQPGQMIHLRALALSTFDLKPASARPLEVTIADGKGNKVFRKQLTTSSYGAASADFQLASQVNSGAYKISAVLDSVTSEKTVTVENYVLPKFAVKLETDQTYYLPGQHVKGKLNAAYFFGKPVGLSDVKVSGFTYDVQRQDFVSLQGATDEQGNFTFEFDLPAYLTGSEFESGLSRVFLQASVTDQTQHAEVSNLSLPVAGSALVVQAIPEGGLLRPGVENILYVMTSYPDGSPAQASAMVHFNDTGENVTAKTGQYGLAEVRHVPQNGDPGVTITATDLKGNTSSQQFFFDSNYQSESVLLRPDKPVYKVGETMNLTLLSSQPQGTVYLDIVRQGQTVSTRSVDVKNGQALAAVDLTPDLYGELELHAYKVLQSGADVRDTRLVVVDNADALSIQIKPGQDTYTPGEQGTLNMQVNGQNGQGVQSLVGVSIVDESVYALAESDPGFAKLYFLLEKEIMQPKYDLHGLTVTDLVKGVPGDDPALQSAADAAAQASLADVVRTRSDQGRSDFSLNANSHQDAMQRASQMQQNFFSGLAKGLFGIVLVVPLGMIGLTGFAIWREKRLERSLFILTVLALGLVLAFFLWPLGPGNEWARTPLDRLGIILGSQSQSTAAVLGILGLASVASYFLLIGLAIQRKDGLLGWVLGMVVLFAGAVVMLAIASSTGSMGSADWMPVALLLTFLLVPLVFLLRFAGYAAGKQTLPAFAALVLGIFLLVGFIPLLGLISSSSMRGIGGRGPVMLEDNLMAQKVALPPVAMPGVPAATQAPAAIDQAGIAGAKENGETPASSAEPPRLRQYFPETLLWLPEAVTDGGGTLKLDVPAADSITTWRVTALASSQDGRLGSANAPLRVFQDFFIDLDLPQSLTVGDEVAIPVGVFNYLPEQQSVRLELEQADWFEMLGDASQTIQIGSNDISVAYFRIHALKFGSQPFKVTAYGSKMSDAILKPVNVFPDGKPIQFSSSDRLQAGTPVQQNVSIPNDAIAGTQNLVVKIYPGVVSQVIEGLDSILRMPNGCFEQTSSTTYPNLLVMDYLKTTGKTSPEVQLKAEQYINLGYQRLITFEVGSTGGFSLFGEAPADRMLTAYGLQEFSDMSRVHDVDPVLIQRAAEWLLSQQTADGSWENDRGLVHENTWQNLENDRLPVTAYIVWSLEEAGYGKDARTLKGLQYIREFRSQAKDAYVAALVANALVAADVKASNSPNPALDESTKAILDQLAEMAVRDGDGVYWQSNIATFMGAEGEVGSIETTAMAAYAFLRSGSHIDLANAALTYLIRQKDSSGTWQTTQATVLSLKALIMSVRAGAEKVNATVKVTLNGGQERKVNVTPENFDVVQLVSFSDVNVGRNNQVEMSVEGEGNLMYQVSGGFYLPWDKLASYPDLSPAEDLVKIDVAYDRTELAVNDTVNVNVTITLNKAGGRAESAMVDLGLPPGFTVQTEDLDALIEKFKDTPKDYAYPTIKRYELTGRQALLYLQNLSDGMPLRFSYHLRARFPLKAQAPASSAYDYYNPSVSGEAQPLVITVK